MTTMTYSSILTVTECASCHIKFAIPSNLYDELRRNHKTFYCPQGHHLTYGGESDIEQANRIARQNQESRRYAETAAKAAQDQLLASERSKAAIKGHLTRARNRIANGVCPCCNKQFATLRKHMTTMHPDYHLTDIETAIAAEAGIE